ncbi:hypothetical protein HMPREF1317_0993 [Schaalia georgiae F0490]|uniref:Uncharacterized protein n=1 Tax=Schaalia georgiae F0490 TaxID=1125717 RepID=J0NN71_9ACTO|nr:hypothetical protein HMPREF1317_0993 [Schaalia georgiae F0490]
MVRGAVRHGPSLVTATGARSRSTRWARPEAVLSLLCGPDGGVK